MRFTKGHALGNDFLVIAASDLAEATSLTVRGLCDRHRGIGADGVIVVQHFAAGAGAVAVFNADGSPAQVSGNGLRIAALSLVGNPPVGAAPYGVTLTATEVAYPIAVSSDGTVAIDLKPAVCGDRAASIVVDDQTIALLEVDVGNPQVVLTGIDDAAWPQLGARLATEPRWPAGTNVVRIRAARAGWIRVDLWERGVGPTAASGTGACAGAVAAIVHRLVEDGPVTVAMDGGSVTVELGPGGLRLTGPVRITCRGVVDAAWLAELRSDLSDGESTGSQQAPISAVGPKVED